jgi:cytochrome P450
MDPEIYPDPEKFDGFRFSKLRSLEGLNSGRLQHAASNLDSMAFGYGRHACPGRFFASTEIKMIMVYLLMNYDFKFPEGVTKRPESLAAETQLLPNRTATVMLKGRS